jgi:hypothetical protein
MTATVILTAQSMYMPEHDQSAGDEQLVNRGIQTLKNMAHDTNSEKLQYFYRTCVELHLLAQKSHRQGKKTSNNREIGMDDCDLCF